MNCKSDSQNDMFQKLVKSDDILVIPGCYDALSAKILEKQGFNAVYMSGAGVSNTKLGLADLGLTTYTEMVDRIKYISGAVSVPLFADADTGFGNPLHVRRTIKGYEQAGASALHIEDQSFPKKCGHFDNKKVVPIEDMVKKIEAAVDARSDNSFMVVARTDARAVEGIDQAIERSQAYKRAGADMIFPEAPQDTDEMREYCEKISGPTMANMVEYGETPLCSVDELEEIGYDVVIFPNSLLRRAMVAMTEMAKHLYDTGTVEDKLEDIASFEMRNELTDYDILVDYEKKYS